MAFYTNKYMEINKFQTHAHTHTHTRTHTLAFTITLVWAISPKDLRPVWFLVSSSFTRTINCVCPSSLDPLLPLIYQRYPLDPLFPSSLGFPNSMNLYVHFWVMHFGYCYFGSLTIIWCCQN